MTDETDLEYEHYGCFACGAQEGDVAHTPEGGVYCAECGEAAIITLTQALRIILEQVEDGRLYAHDRVNGGSHDDELEGDIDESYEDDYDE